MPSKGKELQDFSSSSYFSEDVCFANERQVGILKSDSLPDQYAREKSIASSFENCVPAEYHRVPSLDHPQTSLLQGQNVNHCLNRLAVGAERATSHSLSLLKPIDHDPGVRSNMKKEPGSYFAEGGKINMMGSRYESSLFSSSFSELFSRKCKSIPLYSLKCQCLRFGAISCSFVSVQLFSPMNHVQVNLYFLGPVRLSNNALCGHSVGTVASHYKEEELLQSTEEIEAQTIGNLLPDDDDLLSGVVDGLDHNIPSSSEDCMEEFDFFSSVGGMDLEDDISFAGQKGNKTPGVLSNGKVGDYNGSIVGEHPHGEHPSRTLFVRNINSNVEDPELKALFEQYGDIHNLYTACKHRGFVMISYYDIRAARNAMKALQNRPLRHRKLDIHYSIPKDNPSEKDINQDTIAVFNLDSSVSNDEIRQIFGSSGEIKEIHETPHRSHHKFIEFYDLRAAEAALQALNGSDIAGKRIKLEPSHPGGLRRSLGQQFPLEQDECNLYFHQNNPPMASTTVFGSAGNSSCSLPGHHYTWNISFKPQSHSVMWPCSPSFVNGICAAQPSQLHGLYTASSHLLNTALPMTNHHVGSAPVVNSSIWDRQSSYAAGESPEASGFHPGSLGNLRIANSPESMEFLSRNIFRRVGRNCMDLSAPSKTGGLHSHHPMCALFPGTGQMIPVMNSFDPPNDRARSRRNEANSNKTDYKKQYELDIDCIIRGEDKRTTLMIKNIPNKYTSKMLLAAIDERNRGTYDFIYLPIDFKNKCNVGYAFINMTDPSLIIPLYQTFNGKKWEKFNSEKVATLAYARIQGKASLIVHFQNSSLMNEDKRCRPILFHTDGPNAGDQVAFPMGVNVRVRPGKASGTNIYDENHESPSNMVNGEESSQGETSSGYTKELN